VEIYSVSSFAFPTATPSICYQRLAPQLISGDHKDTLWFGIGHIDDTYVSPISGLSECDTRPLPSYAIFRWIAEDVCDFVLSDAMTVNMWLSRCQIKIEANIHAIGLS
jgi:hypothetical protein